MFFGPFVVRYRSNWLQLPTNMLLLCRHPSWQRMHNQWQFRQACMNCWRNFATSSPAICSACIYILFNVLNISHIGCLFGCKSQWAQFSQAHSTAHSCLVAWLPGSSSRTDDLLKHNNVYSPVVTFRIPDNPTVSLIYFHFKCGNNAHEQVHAYLLQAIAIVKFRTHFETKP